MSKIQSDAFADLGNNTIVSSDGSGTFTSNLPQAVAHFGYTAGGTTVASTGAGTKCAINRVNYSKFITVSTTDNNWTHDYTGYYKLNIRFRQEAGGDVWTLFGVLKDNTTCVGVSGRTGTANSGNRSYELIYKVDSTTADYQLNGWCHSGSLTLASTFTGGKPSWTGYDDLVGNTDSSNGFATNIIVERVGKI